MLERRGASHAAGPRLYNDVQSCLCSPPPWERPRRIPAGARAARLKSSGSHGRRRACRRGARGRLSPPRRGSSEAGRPVPSPGGTSRGAGRPRVRGCPPQPGHPTAARPRRPGRCPRRCSCAGRSTRASARRPSRARRAPAAPAPRPGSRRRQAAPLHASPSAWSARRAAPGGRDGDATASPPSSRPRPQPSSRPRRSCRARASIRPGPPEKAA
mmetsp:Transcript_32828/g.97733  ORF Transcript_32828/g.97733 Transcript_32828/m.97733 type:complete len:214 (-) Transcript_32828:42-683(-)